MERNLCFFGEVSVVVVVVVVVMGGDFSLIYLSVKELKEMR